MIPWRRFVCRLRGHTGPDRIGEFSRCGADLLGWPPIEKAIILQREYNRLLRLGIIPSREKPSC